MTRDEAYKQERANLDAAIVMAKAGDIDLLVMFGENMLKIVVKLYEINETLLQINDDCLMKLGQRQVKN